MDTHTKRFGIVFLTLLLAAAVAVGAGCKADSGDDAGTTIGSSGSSADDTADGNGDTADSADDVTSAEEDSLRHGAVDIARAYFVAQTDFTGDQFDWKAESLVQADDGTWWARVSATPKDMSLESEQIYVYSPADSDFWFAFDMGTGIDPATDDRFPAEVRDEL